MSTPSTLGSTVQDLPLAALRCDGGTQSRVGLDEPACADYADAMRAGAVFPHVVVFFDGEHYWLADGFHRRRAAEAAGLEHLRAEVHPGTRRDAILYSVGANAGHGLRRSNADKRRAVQMLLADQEWMQWSDREIARQCGVGHALVAEVRRSLAESASEPPAPPPDHRTYRTKHGGTATMRTANIGGTPPASPCDALGVPLPPAAQEAFAAADRFVEALRLYDQLQALVDALAQAPGGEHLRQQCLRIERDGRLTFQLAGLSHAGRALHDSRPYAARCPFCGVTGLPNQPQCGACLGLPYVTAATFHDAPVDCQEAVRRVGIGGGSGLNGVTPRGNEAGAG